jgi:hypothetical protein
VIIGVLLMILEKKINLKNKSKNIRLEIIFQAIAVLIFMLIV